MPQIARTTGLFLLGLLAACVVAELGFRAVEATPLRFVLPASEIGMYGPDSETGYRHRAGASGLWLTERRADVTISRLGLRDRERSAARTGDLRVLVVGDSLLEAVQVPLENTAVIVAEKLVAKQRPGAEIINLGLAGATPPVLAARLQSMSRELDPDLAIVVVNIGDFLSSSLRDDSAFTGYRPSPDGTVNLSYGFRNGRGYAIRTSTIGATLYWSLDHLALARVLNSRKNVGLLAEWPRAVATTSIVADRCTSARTSLTSLLSLWRDGAPKAASDILSAFLEDLSAMNRGQKPSVLVAARGFPQTCADSRDLRDELATAVWSRLNSHGLASVDLDTLLTNIYGAADIASLHGFGSRLGRGHLNDEGNRVLGQAIAELVSQWMKASRARSENLAKPN